MNFPPSWLPGRQSDPYIDPVYIAYQTAYGIVVRVAGSAADRHTLVVYGSRYDRSGRLMQLTRTTIQHIRQLPSGRLTELGALVQTLSDRAKKLTPSWPVELTVDVTRSPVAWNGLPGDPSLVMLTTTGLERYTPPHRLLGRLLILSNMQTALRTGRLASALPPESEDPTVITAQQLETALSNVEAKMPKAEMTEMFLDNTAPDDDLALMVSLSAYLADERIISAEDLRFIKERREAGKEWVY